MTHHLIKNLTRVGSRSLLPLALHCSPAPEEPITACTAELRTAVRVSVQDETGQPLEADSVDVSFEGSPEVPCDPSGPGTYFCWEQRGGEYAVRVQVGDREQVSSVYVEADECHIIEAQALTFVFDSP